MTTQTHLEEELNRLTDRIRPVLYDGPSKPEKEPPAPTPPVDCPLTGVLIQILSHARMLRARVSGLADDVRL